MMKTKHDRLNKFLLILSITISVLFVSAIGFITMLYNKYDLNVEKLTSLNNGIRVYSSTGNESTLYNTNRSIVDIDELPAYVKDAFISVEDKNFYEHNGYDIKRIIKSAWVNITSRTKSQGASTISQQLIKNALLSNEKTYSRKIQEIVLAIKMEKQFSKDEILEMYLNTIYFGSNAYGLENASKIYFNKSAKDLNINEACCLAGLIKSPAYYSPVTHYERSIERKNLVAERMLANDRISQNEFNAILESELILDNENGTDNSYEKEAIYEACRLLNVTERDLINKQYEIVTFKADNIQNKVVEHNKNVISSAETATKTNLDSLSIVANNDGHVLAYYANSKYDLHDLRRQPASTLKPFAVYLPCIMHNILSPASLILDEPINYNGFSPNNADKKFHGYVSTRKALSESLNIPAVKALEYVGVKKSRAVLEDFGINISNSDLNLSLALGALKNGVKINDLMQAYITLANQGDYTNLCFVKKILDKNGNEVYAHSNFKTKVATKEDCFLINDILKDCAKTGTAKRLESLNLPIASKTGTAGSNFGNTDLYNISYSSEHTVLTWVADIDNCYISPTLLSSSQPTEINKRIIGDLYQEHSPEDFEIPSQIKKYAYDSVEADKNHIICYPNHSFARYISYDYFKPINAPIQYGNNEFDFSVEMDRSGALIKFDAKKHLKYLVYKQTDKDLVLLKTIQEQNIFVELLDHDVFRFETIKYYIKDENGNNIGEMKQIKPQEFLINELNNEISSSKKKWLV